MWASVEVVIEPEPAVAAMVICPAVEVVMVMLLPWTKVVTPQAPLPWAAKSWPAWVGEAEVAVPPLEMASCPVHPSVKALLAIEPVTLLSLTTKPTRVEPKVEEPVPPKDTLKTDWLLSSPLMLVTTPVVKLERVVEPLWLTVSKLAPVEETIWKGLTAAVPWIVKVAVLVVVPTAKTLETVVEPVIPKVEPELFQTKLAEEAVVEAPVA
jgi:hypothetical protein